MSLKHFLKSRLFFKHLGVAIAIASVSIFIVLIWLNFYTRHGQSRPVPDFSGLSVEQAQSLAKKNKLRFQVIDSIYTTIVPRGTVAEQSPKAGFRVKKWRNVMLTINAFNPEMVAMPNLIDLPLRQASKVLESYGLTLGQRRFKPDLSVNVVIEQYYKGREIGAGDSIQKGSVVDLVLGKGLSNQRTDIPYLLGMELDPAKNRIMEASLNLGTYIYDNTIKSKNDSVNAFVFKQNPEYKNGASLPLGSDMYLWLTVDSTKIKTDTTTFVTDTIPANILSSIPD
ncbi:MAG TPA: PASTA domain-containing protein [Bacteroidales bacterium]|nr:PASTA domain-containing protein [Bacteroidales bacterium]